MNLIFKLKIFGFIAALILGGAVHVLSGLIPGKKNKFEASDFSELTHSQKPDTE